MAAAPPADGGKSFKTALLGKNTIATQSSIFTDVRSGTTYKGEPAVFYTPEEIEELSKPFEFALVGRFANGRPSMEYIRKQFLTVGFKGGYNLGLLDARHILIRFDLREDFHRCWLHESWKIGRFEMKVFRWTHDFRSDRDPPVAPVWVVFRDLPIYRYATGPLLTLAKKIGRPLKIDMATDNLSRPSLARVCIEVDLLKEPVRRIWLDEDECQIVEYEALPQYCVGCKRIGHGVKDCKPRKELFQPEKILPETVKKVWKEKESKNTSGLTNEEKEKIPIDVGGKITAAPSGNSKELLMETSPQQPKINNRVLMQEDRNHFGLLSEEETTLQPQPQGAELIIDLPFSPLISATAKAKVFESVTGLDSEGTDQEQGKKLSSVGILPTVGLDNAVSGLMSSDKIAAAGEETDVQREILRDSKIPATATGKIYILPEITATVAGDSSGAVEVEEVSDSTVNSEDETGDGGQNYGSDVEHDPGARQQADFSNDSGGQQQQDDIDLLLQAQLAKKKRKEAKVQKHIMSTRSAAASSKGFL